MTRKHLFTSESVGEGHPDKVSDQISDAVLDAMLTQDPNARVACETLVTTGMVCLAGEVTTSAYVNLPEVVRETIRQIGYNDPALGFDAEGCAVLTTLDAQSDDIAQGVDSGRAHRTGSGRPRADVRLCVRRDGHADAGAGSLQPPLDGGPHGAA